MQFKVNKERMEALPLEQAIALEDMQMGEQVSLRALRDLFAHFAVDDEGNYLADMDARKAMGRLRLNDLKDIGAQFTAAVKDGVLPPENGAS